VGGCKAAVKEDLSHAVELAPCSHEVGGDLSLSVVEIARREDVTVRQRAVAAAVCVNANGGVREKLEPRLNICPELASVLSQRSLI
jgi:hypothetical protein